MDSVMDNEDHESAWSFIIRESYCTCCAAILNNDTQHPNWKDGYATVFDGDNEGSRIRPRLRLELGRGLGLTVIFHIDVGKDSQRPVCDETERGQ